MQAYELPTKILFYLFIYFFSRKTPSKLKVVAGQVSAINADPNEQTISVYTVTIFPQYDNTLQLNDIALLKVLYKLYIESI